MAFSEVVTHIFALPVQWLATLLALPESLRYINFYLANLFFLTALALGWWSFYLWHKNRQHFYLALYVFILCLGVVGYFATVLYSYAWIYAIVAIVAGIQTVWRLARSAQAPPRIRKLLHHFLIIGVVISIGLPVVYSLHHQIVLSRIRTDATGQLDQHVIQLDQRTRDAEDAAHSFATDQVTAKDLQTSQFTQLTVEMQSRMLEKGLQFVTITNALGTVVSRAQQPTAVGDNLFEQLPWLASAYAKDTVAGLAFNERGLPVVAAAEPVIQNGLLVGVVLTGFSLNDQYAISESGRVHQGLAIGSAQGIVATSANSARQQQLLSSAALSDTVRSTANTATTFSRVFQLNSDQFLVASRNLPTLTEGRNVVLVAARQDITSHWLTAVDAAIVLLGGIAVVVSLVSSRDLLARLRRRKKGVA